MRQAPKIICRYACRAHRTETDRFCVTPWSHFDQAADTVAAAAQQSKSVCI